MYENSSLMPDWDALRLVLAIERHGGVSGAARAMGVTHATVSRRLARAETEAGAVFFERLPAGLRLTDTGRRVVACAKRVEPEIDALERAFQSHDQGLSGPLRVTIPPLMMTDAVSRDIARFAADHPAVQLELVGDNALLNLHRREADVALRVSHRPPETLWGRKITEQHAGFYARSEWLNRSPFGAGDFSGDLPLIAFTSWKTPVPKLLGRLCPNVRVVARCDDMVTAMRMVRAGLGVTRMPRVLGETLEGVRRITALPWEPYLPIWLLTHPDLRKAPKVEAFMRHLSAGMARRRADYRAPEAA